MIEIKNLSKDFAAIRAVNNISFSVGKGEILGFLGPNGAGKSTTMRMITGFIPPSAGTIRIGGFDILKNSLEVRKQIGYLPENAPVYPDMKVIDYLNFCGQIRGFTKAALKRTVENTIEKCFLTTVKQQIINTLSKGYKQRVCFAQSILHDPPYLILDEPTDGLDPNQKYEVRRMIKEMSREKAVIFSTHILEEIQDVCTRTIIIAKGSIVADDTPAGLLKRSDLYGSVSLTVENADSNEITNCLNQIKGVETTTIISDENEIVRLQVYPETKDTPITDKVMAAALANNYQVKSIYMEQGRLDEVFRTITT